MKKKIEGVVGVAGSAQAATFGSTEYWIEHNRHMN